VDLTIWICPLVILGSALGAGSLALVIARVLWRIGRRREWTTLTAEIRLCLRPWVATAAALGMVLSARRLPAVPPDLRRGSGILVIVAVCWLLIRATMLIESALFQRLPIDVADNRRVRRARTQVAVLRRVVAVVAIALGTAGSLMLLPELHSVGASLFASAGLAGIVAGLAAQATLSNMFAGMQLAVTDALRIDDVVVVEGEWGWIEEITLTYVVVHIWDERRLILPTSYFTTTPFQNWTRHQARLLGAVILHLDFAAPLTALREHARQVIEGSPRWDGQDWVLQVTSTTETTMVVRVLASAKDGPTSWDLCCDIREALLVFLQENYPQAMPVRRLITLNDDGLEPPVDLTRLETSRPRPAPAPPLPRRADLRRAESRRAESRRAESRRAESRRAGAGEWVRVPPREPGDADHSHLKVAAPRRTARGPVRPGPHQ
jgi:small-conductance mechanosensitive channel